MVRLTALSEHPTHVAFNNTEVGDSGELFGIVPIELIGLSVDDSSIDIRVDSTDLEVSPEQEAVKCCLDLMIRLVRC